jgi:hypothetical protein
MTGLQGPGACSSTSPCGHVGGCQRRGATNEHSVTWLALTPPADSTNQQADGQSIPAHKQRTWSRKRITCCSDECQCTRAVQQPPTASGSCTRQLCRWPKGPRRPGRKQNILPVGLLLLSLSLPGMVWGQMISCPCLPAAGSGCSTGTQLQLRTATTGLFGTSVTRCMPAPTFDATWAALVLHVCWNLTCLPSAMANNVITHSITNFQTNISA